MRYVFLFMALLVACFALILSPAVVAAQRSELSVMIHPVAPLDDNGEAITVTLMVSCEQGLTVLEAFVYVVQGENQSQFAPVGILCDGKPYRYTISISAMTSATFVPGGALASTYVLLYDPATGETFSEGPSRMIRIH